MELTAQNGYLGPEPSSGYPVNVAIPTGKVREFDGHPETSMYAHLGECM